jgi:hypothetical protein
VLTCDGIGPLDILEHRLLLRAAAADNLDLDPHASPPRSQAGYDYY